MDLGKGVVNSYLETI